AEVGRREQADVLAVLPVDLLDVAGDDELHARLALGVGRRLARAAAALRAAADDDAEAAVLDVVLLHDAAAQADQAVPGEGLVVVVTDPSRGQLVGRDVVDERVLLRIDGDLLAVELLPEQLPVFRQVQDLAGDFQGRTALCGHGENLTTTPGCQVFSLSARRW